MSINNHIDKLIEKNKHIKPVNQTAYHNGFLLLSETMALNELVSNMKPSTRAEIEDIEQTQPPPLYDSRRRSPSSRRRRSGTAPDYPTSAPTDSPILGHGYTIYEPSETEEDNLSRHVMNEVYTNQNKRRDIEGYTKLESLGDSQNVVYKSNKDNVVLYGIRGTDITSPYDILTDLEIGLGTYTNKLPQGTMNDRYDIANGIYNKIRQLYPKSRIIMGGHSLGNSVGLDILYKNKDDKNVVLHGYNGYHHGEYIGDKDPRNIQHRVEGDLVSWWADNHAKKTDTPKTTAGFFTGAALFAAAIVKKRQDLINNFREIDRYINRPLQTSFGVARDPLPQPHHQIDTEIAEDLTEGQEWGRRWEAATDTERARMFSELPQAPETPIVVEEPPVVAEEIIDRGGTMIDGVLYSPDDLNAIYRNVEAEEAAIGSDLKIASLLKGGGKLGVLGGIIYGFNQHLANNFPVEKNLFKKKETDDDDI
jgi:hypothetical protein